MRVVSVFPPHLSQLPLFELLGAGGPRAAIPETFPTHGSRHG
ncbi:MAG: hypothetical protein CM1200mP36_05480 [Gammaproteobacteria bacterium]|nr:MAG: hypothetical protein CM1200mP36_05480 [Gammaproteobacteria bacterium]